MGPPGPAPLVHVLRSDIFTEDTPVSERAKIKRTPGRTTTCSLPTRQFDNRQRRPFPSSKQSNNQNGWSLSQGRRRAEVHQRLCCVLEAPGKAPYVRFTHNPAASSVRMLTFFFQSRFVPTQRVKEKPESRNWGIIR